MPIKTSENPSVKATVTVNGSTDISPWPIQRVLILFVKTGCAPRIIAKGAEDLTEPHLAEPSEWTQLAVLNNELTLQLTEEETSNIMSCLDEELELFAEVTLRSATSKIIQETPISVTTISRSVSEGIA